MECRSKNANCEGPVREYRWTFRLNEKTEPRTEEIIECEWHAKVVHGYGSPQAPGITMELVK